MRSTGLLSLVEHWQIDVQLQRIVVPPLQFSLLTHPMSILLVLLSLAIAWLLWNVLPGLVRGLRCRSIPAFPKDRFFGGHLFLLSNPKSPTYEEKIKLYLETSKTSKIARFNYSFGLPFIIGLVHPDAIAQIFNVNTEAKDFFPYNGLAPFLGNSLVMAGGARWRRQRNLLKQAFGKKEIRSFFFVFRRLAEELVAFWAKDLHDNGHVNDEGRKTVCLKVDSYFSKLTMESILRCAFACEEPNWIEHRQVYGELLDSFFELHMQRFKNPINFSNTLYFRTSQGKQLKDVCDRTLVYAREIIENRKQVMKDRGSAQDRDPSIDLCMVDILLEARDPETGDGMSTEDMVYECNLFLFAGYDTSRLALTWLFYLLASNPDHQRRAQDEVDSVFEENDGELTSESLMNLPYVTMCIKEALRCYPPVPGEMRMLKEDTVVDGHTIPKGIVCGSVRLAIHRDERFWERPNDFFPEHFTPEQESKRPAEAFCPFSTGPRRCLGEMFAMDEMKTVAAYLLRNFDFVIDPDHPVQAEEIGLIVPGDGVRVFIKSRLQ